MLLWTLDKLFYPEHAAKVFGHFYFLPGMTALAFKVIGALEMLIIIGFVLGYRKRLSYGPLCYFIACLR